MAAISLEPQALASKQYELVTTIKHSVTTIADKCLGEGLISQETSSKISETDSTNADKARLLLDNLKATVTGTPESFYTFVTILDEEKSHKNIVEILTNEVQTLRKRRDEAKLLLGYSSKENEQGGKDPTPFVATTVPHEEGQQAPRAIDYAMRDATNLMENLKFVKLDETKREAQLTAVKQELKDAKKEKLNAKRRKGHSTKQLKT